MLCIASEVFDLPLNVSTTIYSQYINALLVFGKSLQLLSNLLTQLTGRGQHQGLGMVEA